MVTPVSGLDSIPRVVLADAYMDGTVWFRLEDSTGQQATVCIDGRAHSPTRHRLFDRARHPKKPEAVLVELGAPEEGLVVSVISRWLDSANPRKLGLTEFDWELLRGALLRLGEPVVGDDDHDQYL